MSLLSERCRELITFAEHKLHSRTDLHFTDAVVAQFADATDLFSFAYLKECFIGTLLLIAGGDETPFAELLPLQIELLRKELKPENPDLISRKPRQSVPMAIRYPM